MMKIVENARELDRIFIINLKHRTDRRERMLSEMKKQQITNYEFFDAIRPTSEEVNEWNPKFCHHVMRYIDPNKFDNYRIGCLGCLKSHLGVIKLALSRGYSRILILEDDTEFIKPWSNFHKFCKPLKDYDMLYLTGSHSKPWQPIFPNIVKVTSTATTGSYCIKERAMRFFVKYIDRYPKEVDMFYQEFMQPRFDCYCTMPHMTKQLDGYSDIQGSNVEYRLNEKGGAQFFGGLWDLSEKNKEYKKK